MKRNPQALMALIEELDHNLQVCNGVIAGANWRLVEDIAIRRARAAATLRAILRWYGQTVPPRCTAGSDPEEVDIADLVAADRILVKAYDRVRALAGAEAPEARLVDEQYRAVLKDRAELSRQLHPVRTRAAMASNSHA